MNTHCMIDLETLGTRPGDVILSIGACLFSPTENITSVFYVTIDPESSKAAGLRAQKSIIEWWQKQDPITMREAFKGELSLESALTQFRMWLPTENVLMYGNGANFDNALLAAAYRTMKMDVPWKFWNDRCYRTLAAMFMKSRVEQVGNKHNALNDAKTQALRLIQIVKDNPGMELK